MKLIPVIGLEIHTELTTASKMFCGCRNEGELAEPNTNICPICVGHPGTLPVANHEAIRACIKAGLALHSKINAQSKFDRKNYFYPDLPKGYQISQYDLPFCYEGYLEINGKKIGITRIHLEEDTAKLTHSIDGKNSFVDFNRSGTPLMELVTNPEMKSPEEAKLFGEELRHIFRWIGIASADMEKGQMRCEGNISLQKEGTFEIVGGEVRAENGTILNPKVELKNINSFRFIERALEFEIQRQKKLIEEGRANELIQETRGWDDQKSITFHQRTKESAHDYRYFPEPDIPPINIREDELREIQISIDELPQEKSKRFIEEYAFGAQMAQQIAYQKDLSNFTEKVLSELREWLSTLSEFEGKNQEQIWQENKKKVAKLAGGWITTELAKLENEKMIPLSETKITPENFAEFLSLVYLNKVNSSAAQIILREMFLSGEDPSNIVTEKNLLQIENEGELDSIVEETIREFPEQVAQFKKGKETVIMFLVGAVMKKSKGKAHPEKVQILLRKKMNAQ